MSLDPTVHEFLYFDSKQSTGNSLSLSLSVSLALFLALSLSLSLSLCMYLSHSACVVAGIDSTEH